MIDRDSPSAGRLLVIDGDPALRLLIAAVFQRLGFTVESAADGAEAMRCLGNGDWWDAVIVERRLGGRDGGAIVRELMRRDDDLLDRTIMLGAADARTLHEATGNGLVRCVLAKPLNLEALVSEVLSCVPDVPDAPSAAREHPYVH